MTEREKLVNLLFEWGNKENDGVRAESIADYLLENEVIVPPCKIGDTVYYVSRGRIERLKIRNINYSFRDREYYVYLENDSGSEMCIDYHHLIGYKLFLTREEAEKALNK